jgi:hypothetical protein
VLTRAVEQRLTEDVQLWLADGLISSETAHALRQRYAGAGFGWSTLVRYVAISGGLFVFLGLLGLVGFSSGSKALGGVLMLAVGTPSPPRSSPRWALLPLGSTQACLARASISATVPR